MLMLINNMKFNVNCNNSIQLIGDKKIYIDPYEIKEKVDDADYIFCTHSHYDHFSPKDIRKILKDTTIIITTKSAKEEAEKLVGKEKVYIVEPNKDYIIGDIKFSTTYAYNVDKPFHPKENKWVGYIIELENKYYYIAGDTDNVEEIRNIKADVAFLPVGGTYTMDYIKAAELANMLDVKIVVPTHYGSVAGKKEDGMNFKKLIKDKEVILFL